MNSITKEQGEGKNISDTVNMAHYAPITIPSNCTIWLLTISTDENDTVKRYSRLIISLRNSINHRHFLLIDMDESIAKHWALCNAIVVIERSIEMRQAHLRENEHKVHRCHTTARYLHRPVCRVTFFSFVDRTFVFRFIAERTLHLFKGCTVEIRPRFQKLEACKKLVCRYK